MTVFGDAPIPAEGPVTFSYTDKHVHALAEHMRAEKERYASQDQRVVTMEYIASQRRTVA